MKHLFAYGSLMCDDIMRAVSGLQPEGIPATLTGYRRWCVTGEAYPAIVPDRRGRVEGIVYLNLVPSAWERLDRFEGEMYARQRVAVHTADRRRLAAAAYVIQPQFRDQLADAEWDYAEFLKKGVREFLKRHMGDPDS